MEPIFFHRVLIRAHRAKRGARGPASTRPLRRGGFTLIEMLVVLVIIVIITAIALAGQSGFNRTSQLNNTAYDIGLSLRQAQSYGLSSYAINGNAPYGLYFILSDPTHYTFFADTWPTKNCNISTAYPDCKPGNGYFNAGGIGTGDTIVQSYSLNNGYTADAACVYDSGGVLPKLCSNDASALTGLSVTFARPNATTAVSGKQAGTWTTGYSDACVRVSDADSDHRYVSVSGTGQVQVGQNTIDTACSTL